MEKVKRIIIDTDIGSDFDDVCALVLAANSPEIKIEGVTTVGGDVALRARIARKLLNLLGLENVPVHEGCSLPLMRKHNIQVDTYQSFGHEGNGLLTPEDDALQANPGHAIDYIIDTIMQNPGEIILVPIGGLTNIALAIIKEPRIIENVKEIVAMGGIIHAYEEFGMLPRLEHNFCSDPEATRIVFESGIPITVVSMNVTLKAKMSPERLKELQSYSTPVVDALVANTKDWLNYVKRDRSELHDPIAIAYLVDPSFMKTEEYYMDMQVREGSFTMIPYKFMEFVPSRPPHIKWGVDIDDDERFWKFFLERVTRK